MYMYMLRYHAAGGYAARSGSDIEKLSFIPRPVRQWRSAWYPPSQDVHKQLAGRRP